MSVRVFDVESLIECEDIWGAKTLRMLGRFGLGAPTVRAWTVTIREEVYLSLIDIVAPHAVPTALVPCPYCIALLEMASLSSKETMAKETDINSTAETDLGLSSRTSSELKAADYVEARNKNRTTQEKGFVDGSKKLEKRLAFPGSRSTMASAAGSGQSISSPF